jgi:glucose-6-phosphate 1-dehydrogenase
MNNDHLETPLLLVIFGITGDLSQRKLLPALYNLAAAGDLPKKLQIVGISRRDIPAEEVYGTLQDFVQAEPFDHYIQDMLIEHTGMFQLDPDNRPDYERLLEMLKQYESQFGTYVSRVYYLSIPSGAFSPIVRMLGETGHAETTTEVQPRLLVEKPFGMNLASAHELVDALAEHFSEKQVYRIDHYVAKETVQNMLVFRFRNPLFESIWNNRHIDHIEITAYEKLDIEGRANFYEQTGALRDLIQSHLLQLLAIITMAKPAKLESDDIHAEKLALLQAIQPADVSLATRGQYEGYRSEVENPQSTIETFARLSLQIQNDNWSGVPITLSTGKALQEKSTEINICFSDHDTPTNEENRLIFRIQPKEGITLVLQTKRPGIQNITQQAEMDFDYARSFEARRVEAYERVIVDAIRGDQTLFASAAEVIRSWEIIEPILEAWEADGESLKTYPKGSNGPVEK